MRDPEEELARLRLGLPSMPVTTTPLVSIEPADRRALDADIASQLISMTFRSRSSNAQPHIVTLRPLDGSLSCTCDAATAECWARKAFRSVKGMQ